MPLSSDSPERSRSELGVFAFDSLLQTEPRPILIGGQAVNLWTNVFLQQAPELEKLQPFVSKDCDLFGDHDLLVQLARKSEWKVTFSPKGQASPVTGYLVHTDAAGQRRLPSWDKL